MVVVAVSLNGCHWSEMSCNGCVGSGFVNCACVLVVLSYKSKVAFLPGFFQSIR